jgi:S-DNA-T family DNA segregation ATPase FtsK/SpoIIIE
LARGEVWALVQEPIGAAAQATQEKRNWAAVGSTAATGLIMALVMFLVTRNPLWAAMPLAGVLATALPLALRRRRPPWFDSVAGLDPTAADPSLIDGAPLELIGPADPVAALARRLIAERLGRARVLSALAVPPEADWAWARFAAPAASSGPSLRIEPMPGGLRLTPGAGWPGPTERADARSGPVLGPGSAVATGLVARDLGGRGGGPSPPIRWVVKDAGLGLVAARATGCDPLRAAGLGTQALEELARRWAAEAPATALAGAFPVTAAAITANWRGPGALPGIGLGEDGEPVRLDLARDGPHALVAGTSGSGKSEFLRSLMLSECVTSPPDRLIIVGLDHKGGATFRDLEHLPQVVGVATDLDALGTSRVLTSLEAELAGRERLLESHGVAAWRELPATARPPRLLVVVDEFRTLLDALPESAGRLERLAAQGRSLGMALILATQRPAGAVSAQLRANLALRICFRVATEADSLDVLGSSDAAHLDPGRPGGCIVVSAGRPPARMRVRMTPPAPRRPCVEVHWPDRWRPPEAVPGDVGSLVDAIRQAAQDIGATIPSAPWCPPLPEQLSADQVGWPGPVGATGGGTGAVGAAGTGAAGAVPDPVGAGDSETDGLGGGAGRGVIMGLADLPRLQRQEPLVWHPASGHLAILGPPRSGRTTAAVTAAAGLAEAGWVTHVIAGRTEAYNGLVGMASFGSLVDARHTERVGELLGGIGRERVALVLDAAAELEACAIPALARPVIDALVQGSLAPAAVLVVTAPAKPSRWLSLCPQRLVLPVADLTDALTLGLPRELAVGARVPGRACYLGGDAPMMMQVALPPSSSPPCRSDREAPLDPPPRVLPLPDRVSADDLPSGTGDGVLWVGLGGHYGAPLGLTLREGLPVGVIGPAGSGRTTALVAMHRRLEAGGRRAVLFGSGARHRWDDVIAALAPGQVVLVDDAESVIGPPPSTLPPRGTLVVSCATATAAAFRQPLQLLHADPRGLLLWPDARGAGVAFGPGVSPGPALDLAGSATAEPPGRGRLILGSKSYAIQVAA